MGKSTLRFIIIFIISAFSLPANAEEELNSNKINKEVIIQQSINGYSGNCPCPYSLDKNGNRCGKKSAYIRKGGDSPICYESDIATGPDSKKDDDTDLPYPRIVPEE